MFLFYNNQDRGTGPCKSMLDVDSLVEHIGRLAKPEGFVFQAFKVDIPGVEKWANAASEGDVLEHSWFSVFRVNDRSVFTRVT